MSGFEIIYNNEELTIGADAGLLTIHINTIVDKGAFAYMSSVEYNSRVQNIWHEFTPISFGDVFRIRPVEVKTITPPIRSIYNANIKQPISKLEEFYKLESFLKEKGLL